MIHRQAYSPTRKKTRNDTMGRKQKLRQEKKRNIKNKAAATAEVTAAAAAAAAAVATTFSTENSIAETAEEKALRLEKALAREKVLALVNQLPKSDTYVQAMADTDNISYREQYAVRVKREERHEERALALDNQLPRSDAYVQARADAANNSAGEEFELFKRGATEDGCVHSMQCMGFMLMDAYMCLALPWFLEGAIRGSFRSTVRLMQKFYLPNRKADALQGYWWTITKKYYSGSGLLDEIQFKNLKGLVERECIICSKTDTKTLTLKQCEGCSVYCYCSEECQTIHWEEGKHRNECKQVQILNKYHKPYAKEIRDAVIRGDKEIPSLEKLRYKLGLTRPREEYEEFYEMTHNGIPIDPDDYLVGREDGKLWVGSVPNSPIGRNDTIIVDVVDFEFDVGKLSLCW